MKKLFKCVPALALACLFISPPALAKAPELSVAHSIEIDAPPDMVWEVISDFAALDYWFPFIESSKLIFGENRRVGCMRELRRLNGTRVEERLIAYDPWNMTYTYTYAGGQPLVSDYFATMSVRDLGNGKSRVEWTARFRRLAYWTEQPPAGQEDKTLIAAFNRIYSESLAHLKQMLETR